MGAGSWADSLLERVQYLSKLTSLQKAALLECVEIFQTVHMGVRALLKVWMVWLCYGRWEGGAPIARVQEDCAALRPMGVGARDARLSIEVPSMSRAASFGENSLEKLLFAVK